MKVLVFEYNVSATGHYIPYARLVAEAVSEIADTQTTVCFPEALAQTGAIDSYFPNNDRSIQTHFFPLATDKQGFDFCRAAANAMWEQAEQVDADYILLPTADGIGAVFSCQSFFKRRRTKRLAPIDALLMRCEHLTPGVSKSRRRRKWVEWMAMKSGPWSRILLLDPLAWASCSNSVVLCPDPVPTPRTLDKTTAREFLGLPTDKRIVVSVGNQNETKGVDVLLHAFCELKDRDAILLLGGPMSDSVEKIYNQLNDDRIIAWNRYLTEHEFQESMIAADVVAVPYRRTERPSGVVCRAVAWNRPLVATDHGWAKWACDILGAGVSCDTSNPTNLSEGIDQALTLAENYLPTKLAKAFSNFNTTANFNRVWTSGIRKTMNLPTNELQISDQLLDSFRFV
jgi:glycosyltransferase involved in cell wall biosynthesis